MYKSRRERGKKHDKIGKILPRKEGKTRELPKTKKDMRLKGAERSEQTNLLVCNIHIMLAVKFLQALRSTIIGG